MNCRHCGGLVSEERVGAGFDYCTKPACVDACIRPLHVVAIGVNKSNDQLALREELDIPRIAARTRPDGGQFGVPVRQDPAEPEVLTDGQRITRMRQALEEKLAACDDQAERTRLVDAHNARVRRMNIRYRRTGLYRDHGSEGGRHRTPAER
ncbi:MAG TPA: hypothetical protein VEH29_05450 [Acidimicrobiales bacterium]|nr:hypothetical protein [Acidimicrobiales bacterium]